jgi:hypothetical protein
MVVDIIMENHNVKNPETKQAVRGKNGGTLYPPKKGHTNNPLGKPKKIPMLEELLEKYINQTSKNNTPAIEIVIQQLVKGAAHGDFRSIVYLLDRIYGKPKEIKEVTVDSVGETKEKEELIKQYKAYIEKIENDKSSKE